MRRTRACAVAVSLALLLATPGVAGARPDPSNPNDMAGLIASVAEANQKLQDIGAEVQTRQEAVNKAIADVQDARDAADAARGDVEAAQRGVQEANGAIGAAQQRFDHLAAAMYENGPSGSYLTATSPEDMIATASASHSLAAGSEQAMTDLLRARTEQVNRESVARAAQQRADKAAADAQHSQDAAVTALTDAQNDFRAQQVEIDRLVAERNAAQAKLNAARNWSAPANGQPHDPPKGTAPAGGDRWDQGSNAPPPAAAGQWDSPWDPTLPAVPSANVADNPITIINNSLKISATSAQITADMGRNFLTQLGILRPADTGITNGQIPRVYGQQASEYVIRRGLSQLGVPYSWGGGTAAGPSHGIGDGAGTVGFDCSGLILYSFAGVGIRLPHYSGSQYNMGRKIPAAEMRRGDVIFYGPGGSQHVTLYLGNGQMLEAFDTGVPIRVAPVRTSGMTPYVVRYIEY